MGTSTKPDEDDECLCPCTHAGDPCRCKHGKCHCLYDECQKKFAVPNFIKRNGEEKLSNYEAQLANLSQEQRRLDQLRLETERQMAECKERVEKERIGANLQVIQGHLEQNKEMVEVMKHIREQERANMLMAENRRIDDAREGTEGTEMRYISIAILIMVVLVCALLMWNKNEADERAWNLAAAAREEARRKELQRQADMGRMSAGLERRFWRFAVGPMLLFLLLVLFWLRHPTTDNQRHRTRSAVQSENAGSHPTNVTRLVAVQPTRTSVLKRCLLRMGGAPPVRQESL